MKMVVALNAYENSGSERLWKWWLWTSMKMVVALNAYKNGGFERLWKWWLWTPMKVVALNAYENGGGFERLVFFQIILISLQFSNIFLSYHFSSSIRVLSL